MSEFVTVSEPNEKDNLHRKAIKAAEDFFARQGYTQLADTGDEQWPLAFRDEDDTLVFVAVKAKLGELPSEKVSRKRAEKVASRYLSGLAYLDEFTVRFDCLSLNVLANDRAFVRHHVGCLSH